MYVLELGGEDDAFAAREARAAVPDAAAGSLRVVAPGLARVDALRGERVRTLAYTHRAGRFVAATDAAVDAATAALREATLDREGTVAVRARDVRRTAGVDTPTAERLLGGVLVDRGFDVDLDDPDLELRALFSGERCVLAWLVAESVRDFGARAPTKRPFFQPGSMDPLLARALANVAGAGPGARLLDPMCGTGGVLIEAGLVGSEVLGTDVQRKMVRGTGRNLAAYLDDEWATLRADATRLPLVDGAVDAVVFDAPYGRQSKVAGELSDVVEGALGEARRVGAPGTRAVVVGDRSWTAAARAAGWDVGDRFERRVHRSLTRHVLVLE